MKDVKWGDSRVGILSRSLRASDSHGHLSDAPRVDPAADRGHRVDRGMDDPLQRRTGGRDLGSRVVVGVPSEAPRVSRGRAACHFPLDDLSEVRTRRRVAVAVREWPSCSQ